MERGASTTSSFKYDCVNLSSVSFDPSSVLSPTGASNLTAPISASVVPVPMTVEANVTNFP